MSSKCDDFFLQLCQSYFNDIYGYCIYLVRGKFIDIAEECTQETFLEAKKQAAKLKAHPNIKGWLHLTARNKVYKSYRRYYIQKKYETEVDLNSVCSPLSIEAELINNYAFHIDQLKSEILKELKTEELRLYHDYFSNKLSISKISKKYNISETAATTRIYRLKKKIKSLAHEQCEARLLI
ncbi:RNA polymerase sigma factor [Paenibacillus macerans]|nr:sigma-70 family RNA polymerase sigma factor [Paenibacillus macerans]